MVQILAKNSPGIKCFITMGNVKPKSDILVFWLEIGYYCTICWYKVNQKFIWLVTIFEPKESLNKFDRARHWDECDCLAFPFSRFLVFHFF